LLFYILHFYILHFTFLHFTFYIFTFSHFYILHFFYILLFYILHFTVLHFTFYILTHKIYAAFVCRIFNFQILSKFLILSKRLEHHVKWWWCSTSGYQYRNIYLLDYCYIDPSNTEPHTHISYSVLFDLTATMLYQRLVHSDTCILKYRSFDSLLRNSAAVNVDCNILKRHSLWISL
jgi:hypothetical protein